MLLRSASFHAALKAFQELSTAMTRLRLNHDKQGNLIPMQRRTGNEQYWREISNKQNR